MVPVDISGVLLLPSPSSSSHYQKRVTAVTPTVPATLGSHCSAHPTVKAKALSDRTDNSEKNPTKNDQKPLHTRLHAPPEVSASRARAPRTATRRHSHSRAPHAIPDVLHTPHALARAPRPSFVSQTATSTLVLRHTATSAHVIR